MAECKLDSGYYNNNMCNQFLADVAMSTVEASLYNSVQALLKGMNSRSASETGTGGNRRHLTANKF